MCKSAFQVIILKERIMFYTDQNSWTYYAEFKVLLCSFQGTQE